MVSVSDFQAAGIYARDCSALNAGGIHGPSPIPFSIHNELTQESAVYVVRVCVLKSWLKHLERPEHASGSHQPNPRRIAVVIA
jgi:hypothetical protein